ncbi:hypothetical protein FACS1894120_4340 [Clostridia bacterium]|nr:hypothetical protein FACS1894120_4340 [Clostridia bacterium]
MPNVIDLIDKMFTDEDKELCRLAEQYLGEDILFFEFFAAKEYAVHKLFDWIIPREGDLGGKRREPWYLAKLIQESVSSSRAAQYCEYKSKENKRLLLTA